MTSQPWWWKERTSACGSGDHGACNDPSFCGCVCHAANRQSAQPAPAEPNITSSPTLDGFRTFLWWVSWLFIAASLIGLVVLLMYAPSCDTLISTTTFRTTGSNCDARNYYYFAVTASGVSAVLFAVVLLALAYGLDSLSRIEKRLSPDRTSATKVSEENVSDKRVGGATTSVLLSAAAREAKWEGADEPKPGEPG